MSVVVMHRSKFLTYSYSNVVSITYNDGNYTITVTSTETHVFSSANYMIMVL